MCTDCVGSRAGFSAYLTYLSIKFATLEMQKIASLLFPAAHLRGMVLILVYFNA